jgi:hypothetical protein
LAKAGASIGKPIFLRRTEANRAVRAYLLLGRRPYGDLIMKNLKTIALATAVMSFFTGAAMASQGPGVSPGTASPLTQWIVVLCGIGLAALCAMICRRHAASARH